MFDGLYFIYRYLLSIEGLGSQELRRLARGRQELREVLQHLPPLLLQPYQQAGPHRIGSGTGIGLVAASSLADADARSQGTLPWVVGGFDSSHLPEPQQMSPLLAPPLGKPSIVGIAGPLPPVASAGS
jgi:hypothetical protein